MRTLNRATGSLSPSLFCFRFFFVIKLLIAAVSVLSVCLLLFVVHHIPKPKPFFASVLRIPPTPTPHTNRPPNKSPSVSRVFCVQFFDLHALCKSKTVFLGVQRERFTNKQKKTRLPTPPSPQRRRWRQVKSPRKRGEHTNTASHAWMSGESARRVRCVWNWNYCIRKRPKSRRQRVE